MMQHKNDQLKAEYEAEYEARAAFKNAKANALAQLSELNLYEEHLLRYQSWIEAVIFEQGEEKLNEIFARCSLLESSEFES